jgi:WD40 repeat protein
MRSHHALGIVLAAGLCFCAPVTETPQHAPDAKPVSFWDHRKDVRLLAFAPAGKMMATVQGDEQTAITVWDLATRTRKLELTSLTAVSEMAFSPDGRLLAASTPVVLDPAGIDPTRPAVVVWDAITGKQQHALTFKDESQVGRLAFAPDGKSLAVAITDGAVTFWDPTTGKQRSRVELELPKEMVGGVERLVFTPNLSTAAGAATDQGVRVWDLTTGKQKRSLPHPSGQVTCITLAPEGKVLAVGTDRGEGRPGELKLWNLTTGKERVTWKEEDGPLRAVAFSPDGKTLASASVTGTIRLRDVASGKETARFEVSADTPHLAFSPDGKLLANVGGQRGARLWDVTTGKERLSPAEEAERDRRDALYRKQQERQEQARAARTRVRNEAKKRLDPRGQSLLEEPAVRARRAEYALLIGQAQRACERWRFKEAKELLNALRPGKDEQDLRGLDWHYLNTRLPREFVLSEREDDRVGAAAVSSEGEVVALSLPDPKNSKRGTLALFDTQTGNRIGVLSEYKALVHALAFSPDRLLLAVAEEDPRMSETEIKLWDATRLRFVDTLRGHVGPVPALQFARHGRTLASAGEDGTLRLWDVQTGKPRHVVRGGRKVPFTSVAFSPDGQTLAAGATGVPVRLWDVETGKQKGDLPFLKDAAAIAFAPFTRHLATSHGKTIVLWEADTLRPVDSFQAPGGSVLFVDHGQQLLCNLSLFDLLTGTERARWDRDVNLLRPIFTTRLHHAAPRKQGGDAQTLLAAGVSPSGRVVAVLSDARQVRLVNFMLKDEPHCLDAPSGQVAGLAFSKDGKSLLALGDGLSRWDASTGRSTRFRFRLSDSDSPRFHFKDKGQSVVSVDGVELPLADFVALGGAASLTDEQDSFLRVLALSPEGRTLATAVEGPTVIDGMEGGTVEAITLRDASTGKVRATVKTDKVSLSGDQITFSPNGLLVTWSDDVVLWDEAGKEVERIKPPGRVWAVRFAPDGKTPATLVVSNRDNSSMRLWDAATGETRATLRGLVGPNVLKFSPDGGILATGDEGGTVRLWDAHTGHLRLTLRGHRGEVNYLAFRPDGKALAAASAGGPVSLWVVRDR